MFITAIIPHKSRVRFTLCNHFTRLSLIGSMYSQFGLERNLPQHGFFIPFFMFFLMTVDGAVMLASTKVKINSFKGFFSCLFFFFTSASPFIPATADYHYITYVCLLTCSTMWAQSVLVALEPPGSPHSAAALLYSRIRGQNCTLVPLIHVKVTLYCLSWLRYG